MMNPYAQAAATEQGRAGLLARIAVEELAGVSLLSELSEGLPDHLKKIAAKHREDEVRHAELMWNRLELLGINDPPADATEITEVYRQLDPRDLAEKYLILQILEEEAEKIYPLISQAIQDHDPITAELLLRMAKDETKHIQFCKTICNHLGYDENRLREFRGSIKVLNKEAVEPILVYNRDDHFEMIQSWGTKLDPDALGCGLVIPDICCGFVDGIGTTKTAYFYCLRANREIPVISRTRNLLRLGRSIVSSTKAAGYTRAITSTANDTVSHFWSKHMGFIGNGESVLTGVL